MTPRTYESQCEYFQRLIQSRADMELVDVYGDQGLSGLIAEKRPELQRMLADARDGKIDLIIVKINGRTEADHRWRELSNSI